MGPDTGYTLNNVQPQKIIRLENISEEWIVKNIAFKDSFGYVVFKAIIDVFFAAVGIVLFLALFLPIAFFIKIDSRGSIIFKQERIGKHRKKFLLYKFRTMYEEHDRQLALWREKDSSSITRIGKILRRSHLDELPQAINLILGDISFVGPRAEWTVLSEVFEQEIPFYKYRYLVKPGIIGWAQINFPPSRSSAEAAQKFEYDLYYIKNRSFLLDLEIILKFPKLFSW